MSLFSFTENSSPPSNEASSSSFSTKNVSSTPSNPTYAEKLKKRNTKLAPITDFIHPSEEQGIIFNCRRDFKLRDYLNAVASTIEGALNIIAASKVSNNRIIIFLRNVELVDSIMEAGGFFITKTTFIACKRLKSPTRKIIFSNISPTITNEILEQFITNELDLKLASSISILRCSPFDDEFGHIVSWRRQVYIYFSEDTKLPGSFLLNFNDKQHRIFITTDELACFRCKSKGHKADDCPRDIEDEFSETSDMEQDPPNDDNVPISNTLDFPPLIPSQPPLIDTITDTSDIPAKIMDKKRTTSVLSDGSSSHISAQNPAEVPSHQDTPKPPKKKKKKDSSPSPSNTRIIELQNEEELPSEEEETNPPSTRSLLSPTEKNFTSGSDYPLSYNNFVLLLDNIKKSKDPVSEVSLMTDNLEGVVRMLEENYTVLEDRSIKIRFTKLKKKIVAHLNTTPETN